MEKYNNIDNDTTKPRTLDHSDKEAKIELTQDELNMVNGGLLREIAQWALRTLIKELQIPPQI